MSSERDFMVKWGYSLKKETTYGTALADGDLIKALLFLGPDVVERQAEFDDNSDEFGKGHEYPTEQYLQKWDTLFKRHFKCSVEALGWIGSLALGSVSSVQPNAGGNPTVYNHTMVPFASSTTTLMPSTTIVEELNQYRTKKYPGLVCAKFTLSGEGVNWVDLEADFVGSGGMAAFAGSIPALSVPNLLRTHSAKLEIGPYGGSLSDVSAELKKWSFSWDNAPDLDDGYYPGSGYATSGDPTTGAVRGRVERGSSPMPDFTFTIRVASDQQKADLEANDAIQIRLTLTGEVITVAQPELYQAILDIYKVKYRAVPVGFENGMQVYNITPKGLYDESVSKIIQLQVQNKDVAYLAT